MKKMPMVHYGKVNLRERNQKNLRVSRHAPDDEGELCWPKWNGTTRWGKREDQRPTFHYFAEDEGEQASGGLNHVVQRTAGEAQWTWKKGTVVIDSGAAKNVMLPKYPPMERSKSGKGFKEPGGEHIKNCGQQVVSVRTPEGFVRKSTWQVADVRRLLPSA